VSKDKRRCIRYRTPRSCFVAARERHSGCGGRLCPWRWWACAAAVKSAPKGRQRSHRGRSNVLQAANLRPALRHRARRRRPGQVPQGFMYSERQRPWSGQAAPGKSKPPGLVREAAAGLRQVMRSTDVASAKARLPRL
jgi:hypothetical protein